MIVKNMIGGQFLLGGLGISLLPGEVIDLSFSVDEKRLSSSKELRKALELGHLQVIGSKGTAASPVQNFLAPSRGPMLSAFTRHPSIRRAVFIKEFAPTDELAFSTYILRNIANRQVIVARTQDTRLLREIIHGEIDKTIVATAESRLSQLERESRIYEGV